MKFHKEVISNSINCLVNKTSEFKSSFTVLKCNSIAYLIALRSMVGIALSPAMSQPLSGRDRIEQTATIRALVKADETGPIEFSITNAVCATKGRFSCRIYFLCARSKTSDFSW